MTKIAKSQNPLLCFTHSTPSCSINLFRFLHVVNYKRLKWEPFSVDWLRRQNSKNLQVQVVGNKAKGRISKQVFQENKACQIFQKRNISYPLISLKFALLPYYWQSTMMKWKTDVIKYIFFLNGTFFKPLWYTKHHNKYIFTHPPT